MSMLYELSAEYEELFSEFDRLNEIENELTPQADGTFTDESGNVITDVANYKQELLDAWFDTLEGIEGEIEQKLVNIACHIKELKIRSYAASVEKKRLAAKEKSIENRIDSLEEYILGVMKHINRKKIDAPQATLTLSDGRESVKIENEAEFIKWAQGERDDLLSYKQPEISKKAVKLALESGEDIPLARIAKTPYVTIK